MAVNKNTKQGTSEGSTQTLAARRKTGPKALGTRVGTLEDWREGSLRSGSKRGNVLRDGR